eukprot:TRINITY_DN4741_c0_g1_i3.p1 TRINITY_DN4741_c0_g1~~TRINITY_DN4741_c0_g1_i3.p1  ORF type:complete len:291 (+),score=20.55 TRINITY_DN4741_c0_g1_i3:1-873(+)
MAVQGISGASGAMAAMTCFYPLDLIRSVIQTDSEYKHANTLQALQRFASKHGWMALYTGLDSMLVCLASSNFVYFNAYNRLKRALQRADQQELPFLTGLLVGILAGSVNVLSTTPLWVANMRLRFKSTDRGSSIFNELVAIYRQDGIIGLWSGVGPSLLLVLNPAIQFLVYDRLKHLFSGSGAKALSNGQIFIISVLAKLTSTTITYPLQLIQNRLRKLGRQATISSDNRHSSESSLGRLVIVKIAQRIIQEDGFLGLWRGLDAKLLQTLSMTAFMFLVYERILQRLSRS